MCSGKGGLWYVGVLHRGLGVLHRGQRGEGGVFRRLCVGMILGWDFY